MCSFGISYGFGVLKVRQTTQYDCAQTQLDEEQAELGLSATHPKSVSLRFLSLLTSLVVVLINFCLKEVIRYASKFEKHETYTNYNLSVAFKLVLVSICAPL